MSSSSPPLYLVDLIAGVDFLRHLYTDKVAALTLRYVLMIDLHGRHVQLKI